MTGLMLGAAKMMDHVKPTTFTVCFVILPYRVYVHLLLYYPSALDELFAP